MPILDPLRGNVYESGALIQKCDECQWAQRGHKAELAECPVCGAVLGKLVALSFGGIGLVYTGKNVDVYQICGGWVTLEEQDLPEIVRFLCKHVKDVRTGHVIHDGGRPRRVAWQKSLSDMLRDRKS